MSFIGEEKKGKTADAVVRVEGRQNRTRKLHSYCGNRGGRKTSTNAAKSGAMMFCYEEEGGAAESHKGIEKEGNDEYMGRKLPPLLPGEITGKKAASSSLITRLRKARASGRGTRSVK